MHIAFDLISETGLPGGIRTYWSRLIAELASRHPQDSWSLVGAKDLAIPEQLLQFPNVQHIVCGEINGGALRRRVRQQLALPAVLARAQFDAVHSLNNVLPLSSTIPRIVTIHDRTVRHTPERFSWPKRLYLSTLVPASVRSAAQIITISEATRRDLVEEMPRALRTEVESKTQVIPLAVSAEFHGDRSPEAEDEIRNRLGLPDRFTFFIGALEPGKNISRMLEAQRILAGRCESVPPLVIAGCGGSGGVQEEIERCSHQPVQLLGRVNDEDLPHLYRMAHVFLFPSLWEGFGLPVLEAFASGTPVVTSNISALPEVAGDAATLVDPDNPWDIADAWSVLWNDDERWRKQREDGLRRAAEFAWETVATRTYAVYQQVACPLLDATPTA